MKRLFSSLLLMGLGLSAPLALPRAAHAQDLPRLSIADASVAEGNSRFREIIFPVTLNRAVTFDVSARYSTANGTAVSPGDYAEVLPAPTKDNPAIGQVVIKAGQRTARIVVRVTTDTVEEADETFGVTLFAPKRAAFADADAVGTIRDDDYAGQISVGDASIPEGNSGSALVGVPITFSTAPLHPIEVRFQTTDDTAKVSLGDYGTTRGALTVQPGATGLTLAVPITADTNIEADEKFFVRISAPGFPVSRSLARVVIVNDDIAPPTPTPTPPPPPVAASIADTSVVEGNGGENNPQTGTDTRTFARFTVTLAQAATADTQLSYFTKDGASTSPNDYSATSGTLLFRTGETTATFDVLITGDRTEEADKAFSAFISAPGGITGDAEALGTIRDDDYAGRISIDDTTVTEGNAGTVTARLTITLSQPALHPLEVVFGTADGTATSRRDYIIARGIVLFPTGTTALPVEAMVNGDTANEANETLSIEISSNNSTFTKFSGVITVLNDDVPLRVTDLTGKIVFVSTRDGNDEIYIMNANGTNQTRLTNNPASDSFPRLSADGRKVVFQSDRDGNLEIYIMNADGTGLTRLTDDPLDDEYPSISADGTRIAFDRVGDDGFGQIYVMNANGTGETQLPSATDDIMPAISPDGQRIAYVEFGLETDQLIVMNANGTNRVVIAGAEGASLALFPTFSPDGRQISLSFADLRGNPTAYDLYSLNVDGTNLTRLTFASEFNLRPAYSPEGDKLAFSSARPASDGIFVIRDDGTEELRVVDGSFPSWSIGSVPGPPAGRAPASGGNS